MIARWFGRQDPLIRFILIWVAIIAALVLLALVALPAADAHASAAGAPPAGDLPPGTTVTIRARVTDVSCLGPCCCAYITGDYQGRLYGASYCRWFRPLRTGEVVEKTGRANAQGWLR